MSAETTMRDRIDPLDTVSTATSALLASTTGVSSASPASRRRSDAVYDALKRAIVLRAITPGTQLREQSLAAEHGCSQGTVREALINLVTDGLVERSGYRGTFVTDTSLAEATAFVRIRLTIERQAARVLAGRSGDREEAAAILDIMAAAQREGDFFLASELDRRFHAQLAIRAGLELLSPILMRCALHIHRFTLGSVEVPREFVRESGLAEEHAALLRAVEGGDTAAAEAAVSMHLDAVLRRWAPSLHRSVGADAFTTDTGAPR